MIPDMHEDYLWKRLVYQFFTFCPGAPHEEVRAKLYTPRHTARHAAHDERDS